MQHKCDVAGKDKHKEANQEKADANKKLIDAHCENFPSNNNYPSKKAQHENYCHP